MYIVGHIKKSIFVLKYTLAKRILLQNYIYATLFEKDLSKDPTIRQFWELSLVTKSVCGWFISLWLIING